MNLIGNAVKFTASGYVRVSCSIDRNAAPMPGEVSLKFVIQYVNVLPLAFLYTPYANISLKGYRHWSER